MLNRNAKSTRWIDTPDDLDEQIFCPYCGMFHNKYIRHKVCNYPSIIEDLEEPKYRESRGYYF